MVLRTVSTILGILLPIASTSPPIIVVIALTRAGILVANVVANATIPSPILVANCGIRSIAAFNACVSIAIPADPRATKAPRPAENINIPAPAAIAPIPSSATATPKPSNVGITGVNNAPAAPITAKAPANPSNIIPSSFQLSVLRSMRDGVSNASAAAMITIVAAPANPLCINVIATVNIVSAPPRAVNPLTISIQLIPPRLLRTLANIFNAPPRIVRPTALRPTSFGMNFIANIISVRAPAIAASPFPMS